MKPHFFSVALLLGLFGAFALLSPAAAEDKKAEKGKVFEDKATKAETATAINFNKALGLDFESLSTLGIRIEAARKSGDPVALASDAQYLAAAEAASGKKADLTSAELMKEAVTLAKARDHSSELKALAALTKGQPVSKELEALAEKAEKSEAEAIAKFKSGEKTKGIWNTLTVRNFTAERAYIYVNGSSVGSVSPFHDAILTTPIRDPASVSTLLYARTADGSVTWGPRIVSGAVDDFTWSAGIPFEPEPLCLGVLSIESGTRGPFPACHPCYWRLQQAAWSATCVPLPASPGIITRWSCLLQNRGCFSV